MPPVDPLIFSKCNVNVANINSLANMPQIFNQRLSPFNRFESNTRVENPDILPLPVSPLPPPYPFRVVLCVQIVRTQKRVDQIGELWMGRGGGKSEEGENRGEEIEQQSKNIFYRWKYR